MLSIASPNFPSVLDPEFSLPTCSLTLPQVGSAPVVLTAGCKKAWCVSYVLFVLLDAAAAVVLCGFLRQRQKSSETNLLTDLYITH